MKTLSLYNGAVQIEFDAVAHCYRVIGTEAKPDGVTTILGLVPKYLLPWVARTTADYIRQGILDRLAGEGSIEPTFLGALCEEAKKEYTRKKESAGDVGTLVHALAEEIIAQGEDWEGVVDGLFESTPTEAHAGGSAFVEWWRTVAIDRASIQSERIVFSRRLFYCGTCDLFANIDGRPTVVDFKTGKGGLYDEHLLQIAAYAMALEEELGVEIKDGWIIHLNKESGACTPHHIEITPKLKTDWEAIRIAWRAVKRNQDRHKEIKRNQKNA